MSDGRKLDVKDVKESKRPGKKNVIVDLNLTRIDLVGDGANRGSYITMYKSSAGKPAGKANINKEDTKTMEDILKSADSTLKAYVEQLQQSTKEAQEQLEGMKLAEAHREALAKAAKLKSLPATEDELIAICKSADDATYKVLEAAAVAMDATVLKKPAGTDAIAKSATTSGWEEIAKSRAAAEGITFSKAVAVLIDEQPELFKEEYNG